VASLWTPLFTILCSLGTVMYADKKGNEISLMYSDGISCKVYEEIRKYLAIHMRMPLVIYDFATDPF
jgi:hypothetical protein